MVQRQIETSVNRKPLILFKLIVITLWGLFLLLNTWTESIEELMYLHTFGFKWVPNPDFHSFFYFHDFTAFHPEFIKVKLGHFIGFAVLDFLLFNLLKSHKYSIAITFVFAFITEFVQLFFGRDGRFYDLMIDTFGIFSVFFIIKYYKLGIS